MIPAHLTPDERYEVTPEQAVRIARGWVELLASNWLTVLASERPVVNDDLRLAGTLDRVVRLGRDLHFDDITVPAGTVLVLDIKTSKLHADNDGIPSYWDSYPIQIAVYASAVPFDTEAEQRLAWDEPIDQQHALIGHLDVERLIADDEVLWSLIHVDLDVGRQGIAAVVAAKAYHSLPKFKLAVPSPPTDVEQPLPGPGEVSTVAAVPSDSGDRREALRHRKTRMQANAVELGWGSVFAVQWYSFGIGPDSTDDEIQAALDAIEPPFENVEPLNPQPTVDPQLHVEAPDDGGPCHGPTLDTILAAIKDSPVRAVVNGWLKQSADAGESWSPRLHPTIRHYEISRAAYFLAVATDGDDDYARCVLAQVIADAEQPAIPVGVALGALTIDEARHVTALARAFGNTLSLQFSDDGHPLLVGDVAAVLAAA